jgi:hypothetical protein
MKISFNQHIRIGAEYRIDGLMDKWIFGNTASTPSGKNRGAGISAEPSHELAHEWLGYFRVSRAMVAIPLPLQQRRRAITAPKRRTPGLRR